MSDNHLQEAFSDNDEAIKPPLTVIVIGAGLSGLACAYALKQAGLSVQVLEAAPQAGGWIQSFAVEDHHYLLEGGPNSFPSSSKAVVDLAEQLGVPLVAASPTANHRFVAMGAELLEVPYSIGSALTTKLLPLSAKLRLLQEPFIAPLPADAPEETVAQFVERRLGAMAHTRMVQPFLTGVYAGNSHELSAKLVEYEQKHGSIIKGLLAEKRKAKQSNQKKRPYALLNCAGGMKTLIQKLEQALTGKIFLNTAVTALRQTPSGWQLALANGQQVATHGVVIATPAFVASQLMATVSGEVRALLDTVDYAPITVVYQAFKKRHLAHRKEGFGALRCWEVPNPVNQAWLGSLWTSSIFPNRCPKDESLVSHFFGGSSHTDVLLWSETRAIEEATAQSAWLLGTAPKATPTLNAVFNYAKAIPQYTLGHDNRMSLVKTILAQQAPSLQLAGNYLQGINLNNCVLSGQLAAENLLKSGVFQAVPPVELFPVPQPLHPTTHHAVV
jgi:protoporphyrinogen/coproporphyrinogen III oxidase